MDLHPLRQKVKDQIDKDLKHKILNAYTFARDAEQFYKFMTPFLMDVYDIVKKNMDSEIMDAANEIDTINSKDSLDERIDKMLDIHNFLKNLNKYI